MGKVICKTVQRENNTNNASGLSTKDKGEVKGIKKGESSPVLKAGKSENSDVVIEKRKQARG